MLLLVEMQYHYLEIETLNYIFWCNTEYPIRGVAETIQCARVHILRNWSIERLWSLKWTRDLVWTVKDTCRNWNSELRFLFLDSI